MNIIIEVRKKSSFKWPQSTLSYVSTIWFTIRRSRRCLWEKQNWPLHEWNRRKTPDDNTDVENDNDNDDTTTDDDDDDDDEDDDDDDDHDEK